MDVWVDGDKRGELFLEARSVNDLPRDQAVIRPTEVSLLLARSYARLDARVSVDGATRLSQRFAGGKQPPVVELRVPLGAAGWHLITFDTPALPEVNGRQEGVRLLSYVDS